MAEKIPSLWPEDAVAVDILSPLAILKVQAGRLAQLTRGVLEAEVTTQQNDAGVVQHHFDVIAPALDGYRRRILTVTHNKDEVYPAKLTPVPTYVAADPSARAGGAGMRYRLEQHLPYETPTTEREFITQVGAILSSGETKATLQSLIARSNDRRTSKDAPPPAA